MVAQLAQMQKAGPWVTKNELFTPSTVASGHQRFIAGLWRCCERTEWRARDRHGPRDGTRRARADTARTALGERISVSNSLSKTLLSEMQTLLICAPTTFSCMSVPRLRLYTVRYGCTHIFGSVVGQEKTARGACPSHSARGTTSRCTTHAPRTPHAPHRAMRASHGRRKNRGACSKVDEAAEAGGDHLLAVRNVGGDVPDHRAPLASGAVRARARASRMPSVRGGTIPYLPAQAAASRRRAQAAAAGRGSSRVARTCTKTRKMRMMKGQRMKPPMSVRSIAPR
jgi:hypothetical protein